MGSKAIKVSESTYALLKKRAEEEGIPIKEVVDRMASDHDIFDYSGSWEMTDDEQEEIQESTKEMWEGWQL